MCIRDSFELSSLRTGIRAGSPCPIAVMEEVIARMHMREVTIAYGMTETSPVSFQSETDDPLDLRVSTVGRIQPHLEVKLCLLYTSQSGIGVEFAEEGLAEFTQIRVINEAK